MENKNSNTEKLSLDISKRVQKHNIPAIFVAGDKDKKHSCVVMDSRKEMRELNISVMVDAMLNGEPTGELINVVCASAAIVLAHSPKMEEQFFNYLNGIKETKVESETKTPITQNRTDA